jgi:hypothetical protein
MTGVRRRRELQTTEESVSFGEVIRVVRRPRGTPVCERVAETISCFWMTTICSHRTASPSDKRDRVENRSGYATPVCWINVLRPGWTAFVEG